MQLAPTAAQATLMCLCCGRGAADWCNTCEVNGTQMEAGSGTGGRTGSVCPPMCGDCVRLDRQCRLCGTRPSEGPQDADFLAAAESSGEEVSIQVAGAIYG